MPTTSSQRLLRLLIVDDVARVRRDLRLLLSLSGAVEVAGEAANGRDAVETAERLQPDVVVMDLAMPVMNGLQAGPEIAVPSGQSVILNKVDELSDVTKATWRGRHFAFYVKDDDFHAIVDKLHDEVVNALALPSVQERLAKIGVEKLPMTVAEFDRFFKDDVATNLELVKAANISRQ